MPYYDGTCDECGAMADIESPMYCLCWECYDRDFDGTENDEEGEP